jgi:hypothetical protein
MIKRGKNCQVSIQLRGGLNNNSNPSSLPMDVSSEFLYPSLLEQLSHRGERGLLRGAKTTATKSCLELGLLVGKMVGSGEVTEEWAMHAILAIGRGNWSFFRPLPEVDCHKLGKWKPHSWCVAYYRPTYLDRVKYTLAKQPTGVRMTRSQLETQLEIDSNSRRQVNHLSRVLREAVASGTLSRYGSSYRIGDTRQVPRILQAREKCPNCEKCRRRLSWSH